METSAMRSDADAVVGVHSDPVPIKTGERLSLELVEGLRQIEENMERGLIPVSNKIAVFDLDNTLLIGHINETLTVQLLNDGYQLPPLRSSYRNLGAVPRRDVRLKLATSMNCLPLRSLVKATHKILCSEPRFIEAGGGILAMPYPHPVMLSLVRTLELLKYRIYVITSSNEVAARIIASQFFNIPASRVFGLRHRIEHDIFTNELLHPVPVDNGKVETYLKYVGVIPPIITGGSTSSDIPLLRLTDPYGLCLWVGGDRIRFESAQVRIGGTQQFHFVPLEEQLQFQQKPGEIR